MISFELFVDIAIILLLILTIIFIWRLNRNLSIIRDNQDSLFNLAQNLNDASDKAGGAVASLKSAALETASGLEKAIRASQTSKEELTSLMKNAESLAAKLETTLIASQSAQKRLAAVAALTRSIPEPKVQKQEQKSEAELELLKALRSIR
ncbi:MAG: hypothetical protein IJ689_01360 [Alphaproteobacteria bacterium]|nr:hypothetical protein [Alphaproteobacteria bacterium]